MKKLIEIIYSLAFLTLLFSLFSCKKQTIEPGQPIKIIDNLYNFRCYGLKTIDSASVKINGVQVSDPFNGYSIKLNRGDTLTFYYYGNMNLENADYDFAIWNAGNILPSETIKYFYSTKIRAIKKYSLGIPNYCNAYLLTGQYIVK